MNVHIWVRVFLAAVMLLVGVTSCGAERSDDFTATSGARSPSGSAPATGSPVHGTTEVAGAGGSTSLIEPPMEIGDGWSQYGVLGYAWGTDVDNIDLTALDASRDDSIECGIDFSIVWSPTATLHFNSIDGLYMYRTEGDSIASTPGDLRLGASFADIRRAFPTVAVRDGDAPGEFVWEVPEDLAAGRGTLRGHLEGPLESSASVWTITGLMPDYFAKCAP